MLDYSGWSFFLSPSSSARRVLIRAGNIPNRISAADKTTIKSRLQEEAAWMNSVLSPRKNHHKRVLNTITGEAKSTPELRRW